MKNAWLLAVMTIAVIPTYCARAEENRTASQMFESDTLLKNTRIAVVEGNKKESVIVTMNSDGSNPLRLTREDKTSQSPSWAPDGKKISYMSTHTGKPEIYVMNADGSNTVQLTKNKGSDDFFGEGGYPNFPSWSPDGKKIVFVSSNQEEHRTPELYVMNADGTNPTRLTHTQVPLEEPKELDDFWIIWGLGPVAWSPDGKKIVYSALNLKDKRMGIHVMNADGTLVRFTKVYGSHASWSPDGKRIVFKSGDGGIRIMDADGTNLISLPKGDFPCWLPDGKRIAFVSRGDGANGPGIYVMNADGTHSTQIRDVKGTTPVWSPFLR